MARGDFDGFGCVRLWTAKPCWARWMYCSNWFITEMCKDMSAGLQQAACLTWDRHNTHGEGHLIDASCVTAQSVSPVCTCILCSYSLWLLKLLFPEMESRYTMCFVWSHGLHFAAGRNNVKVLFCPLLLDPKERGFGSRCLGFARLFFG
jgi:hypothetical protein